MDRRTLLKSSGLLFGGIAASRFLSTGYAQEILLDPIIATQDRPILLNFNENSLGMSPKALQTVIKGLAGSFRYPDLERETLHNAIANTHKVKTECITLGNGSSETIQATIQAIATEYHKQGKKVQLVVPDPTFNYAELYAKPFGITICKIPLTTEMLFDLNEMQKRIANFKGTSIVYLCNPNNPTATITPTDQLHHLINQSSEDTFFLIDEAYAEYVEDANFKSAIELVKMGRRNVLITRTFSKIYALAGLRIGYGVAHPETIATVEPFVSIDNTNFAAATAATISLEDSNFLELSRKSNTLSRKVVTTALQELQIEYLPSHANFIFHKVKGDVKTYQKNMKERHIYVGREFPPAVGWSRLTLGTPQEMMAFVNVLKQMRYEGLI